MTSIINICCCTEEVFDTRNGQCFLGTSKNLAALALGVAGLAIMLFPFIGVYGSLFWASNVIDVFTGLAFTAVSLKPSSEIAQKLKSVCIDPLMEQAKRHQARMEQLR